MSHLKMILRKPRPLMKRTRNKMEHHAVDVSVRNMSSLTIPAVSTNQNGKRVFVSLCHATVVKATMKVALFSRLFIQQFNSMSSTDSTTFDTSSTPTSCRLVGSLGFVLVLETSASDDSTSSSFSTTTSSRVTSSGPVPSTSGAGPKFRVFLGLTSALICRTRFVAAEKYS